MMAHNVLDLYGGVLGHSDAIDELFLKLHKQVNNTPSPHPIDTPFKVITLIGSIDTPSQYTLVTRPLNTPS